MKPLDKPAYKGVSIVIFGIFFHLNWAKSLLWGETTERGIRHTHFFSVFRAQKSENLSALTIIIGPIKLMMSMI